jgi:hypothetical protein
LSLSAIGPLIVHTVACLLWRLRPSGSLTVLQVGRVY